jgi:hypothetical protein
MNWFIDIIKKRLQLNKIEFNSLPDEYKKAYAEFISNEPQLRISHLGDYSFDWMTDEQKNKFIKTLWFKGLSNKCFDFLSSEEKEKYLADAYVYLINITEYQFNYFTETQKISYSNRIKHHIGLYGFLLDYWRDIQKRKKTAKNRNNKIDQILN